MRAYEYTHLIEPIIAPDREKGELGVFNPTACYDRLGRMQILYRAAEPSRVTRLARSVLDRGQYIRQKPPLLKINTGDQRTDMLVTVTLSNSAEDPRLIRLPGDPAWYTTIVGLRLPAYSAGQKAVTVLAKVSQDFERYTITRLLTPGDFDDRHVIPFPIKFDGEFALLSRPQKPGKDAYVDLYTDQPSSVYLSRTPDLSRRPNDRPLLSPEQPWEAKRIGGVGPQPVLTSQGWLVIYMAIDHQNRYSVGAALLDPHTLTVTARTPNPLLTPDEAYNQRFPVTNFGMQNVIFATTALVDEKNDRVTLLVGCNDIRVGRVDIPLSEMYQSMDREGSK